MDATRIKTCGKTSRAINFPIFVRLENRARSLDRSCACTVIVNHRRARVYMCVSFLYRSHYRRGARNLVVITRRAGAGKENERRGGTERLSTRGGVCERRHGKKRKRVASLHRCRFRALPLQATFAPGTAYVNGKTSATTGRYSTSVSRLCYFVASSGRTGVPSSITR